MTNKDLNLAIAEYKGEVTYEHNGKYYILEMGLYERNLPDYINDPELNRKLELELLQAGLSLHQPAGKEYYWAEEGYQWFQEHSIEDVDLGRATAQAYHKQFIGDL